MTINDIPSPIDLRSMPDAQEWEATAMSKRPWRTEFFDRFLMAIRADAQPDARVLELGSGPGFLAAYILQSLPDLKYVALDFSAAMHQLAVNRLGHAAHVEFVERSFRDADWMHGLGSFSFVITHQAVHELRHKAYAPALHRQVKKTLTSDGCYLVCDHFAGEGGMKDQALYMSVEEQRAALIDGGFANVQQLLLKGGLVLHCAR